MSDAGQMGQFDRGEREEGEHSGAIVGAPLKGRVLIVDDVITAGTAIRESVEIIRSQGATPAAVLIALDREERGQGTKSAVQAIKFTVDATATAAAAVAKTPEECLLCSS